MSWIAIAGDGRRWTDPAFFEGAGDEALMPRGSLVIETRLAGGDRPQTLLSHGRRHPWPGGLSIQAMPGGNIVLVIDQDGETFHTLLECPCDARTDLLRLTFSWESPRRWGRLVLERPGSERFALRETPPPPPLVLGDIRAMMHRPGPTRADPELAFIAVSDAVEPVGPMPSVCGDAPVSTPLGPRALADLRCGDTVHTQGSGVVPVLHRVEREVPALGSFRPVRLRAPWFGLQRDLVVAPGQALVVGGSDVEYTFGRAAVLVPAASLVQGFAADYEEGPLTVRYAQLVLPGHEAFVAAGVALESLYVGRLRRDRARQTATLLEGCSSGLMPEHCRAGLQVLRPFEAVALAEARAA
ncbi:Hint domain-containing protein [Salipiger mucosus]|uniref:Hedgehog/Intein (Hint) domain-containing protein n=1 Tax=Salipiger mucosus DSM 16094 TaxID=1123237 RepID=S9QIY6_9RHOB|nr:Hint domain-containing protein [Salipiger mucosus]EPX79772.1 hypothetical protein Salmuc_05130 [Salipiger mucosus DSM 16094]